MKELNDGGPAFPPPMIFDQSGNQEWVQQGLTIRDWFAGQALAGMVANDHNSLTYGGAAFGAYEYADAMLRERKVKP